MAEKKRISYYDVAKGILICLVIISHIFLETLSVAKITNDTFSLMRNYQWFYVSFFMPAFFIITGICSNYNKEFASFLIRNVRTILVPAIIFDLVLFTIPHIIVNTNSIYLELFNFTKRALAFGGVFWFLPCLFLSKIIYWVLYNYTKDSIHWIILIVLVVFGFSLHHYNLFPQKWWYAYQTCDLTIFLGIGQYLKNSQINNNLLYQIGTIVYLFIIATFFLLDISMPSVLYTYKITDWWQLPIHILISVTGTMFILLISKKIESNSILEYLGRGTIVVYGVNQLILKIILNLFHPLISNQKPLQSFIMFAVLFIIVVSLSALAIRIFNTKYLKVIIGK